MIVQLCRGGACDSGRCLHACRRVSTGAVQYTGNICCSNGISGGGQRRLEPALDDLNWTRTRSFVRAIRIACRFVAALLLAVGAVQRMSCTQISSRISSGTTFCAVLVLHKWTRVCCLRVATCRGLGKTGWGREGGDGSLDRVLIACFLCRYAGRGKEQAPF